MNVYIPWTWFATQWPCDSWFHVPLKSEWTWLISIMVWLGYPNSNWDNWKSLLHLPYAWTRAYTNEIESQWTYWSYWASTPAWSSYTTRADRLQIWSSIVSDAMSFRGNANSIRAFKDEFVVPTSWWTVIAWTLGSWGIFWNTTDWIISITWDWSTWYTIKDKNEWATVVYNSWDTLSQNNCGKYYQFWNNYWFAWTGSVTTSSTQVNASSYWPWNYYSSSTFITWNQDWSSSQNDNLWWWVSWNIKVMSELKNAYIGEYVEPDYLCFTANTAGSTVKLNKTGSPTAVTLETSTDGSTWSTYTFWSTITLSNIGDKVYWRNTSETDTRFSVYNGSLYQFVMTWSISWSWDVNFLLNKNSTTTLSNYCFIKLFYQCSSLTTAPKLPATTLADNCYHHMFDGCDNLTTLPKIYVTSTATDCCGYMFNWCSKIKISTTQTWDYQTPYRIPPTWTGTGSSSDLYYMFYQTWWTFTGTPSLNTTYYTSNTVV